VCVCVSFQADSISGFHSNTHIPVVIGAQMRYEVTGDPLYKVKFIANLITRDLNIPFIESDVSVMGCRHKCIPLLV